MEKFSQPADENGHVNLPGMISISFRVLILKRVDLSRCNYPPYWNRVECHSRTIYQ